MYTYIHIYTHTYSYIHIYTHTYTYIHVYTHIYTFIHIYTYAYTYIHIYAYIYTYTHMYTHIYTYIHIHTHIYTYVHICTHLIYKYNQRPRAYLASTSPMERRPPPGDLGQDQISPVLFFNICFGICVDCGSLLGSILLYV